MKTLELKILIDKIEVDEFYYTIDYTYYWNGKEKKESYESDYEGWSKSDFKKHLRDGGAIKIVLEQIANK